MKRFKRLLALLLTATLCWSLTACGDSNGGYTVVEKKDASTSDKQQEQQMPPKDLALEQVNSIADYLDFTLVKIQTSPKIEASMSGGFFYENDTSGETYVDIVLDITNTGTQALQTEDILTASATNAAGAQYSCDLYAIETGNNSNISTYEEIAPLSTARFHCGISVPESETALTLQLKIKDETYRCDYTMGETLANLLTLNIGQTIEETDYATMQLFEVGYTADLLPSNTSGAYTHYPVENPDNVYLVATLDVTNYQGTAQDIDTFVSVKAVYRDKYTYTGFVITEDDDKNGFRSNEDISPLSTRRLFYLIEVPKTVMEESATLHITFRNKEYTYCYTPA